VPLGEPPKQTLPSGATATAKIAESSTVHATDALSPRMT
jgi:hypothetical protein